MEWLVPLVVIPAVVLAKCTVPRVNNVTVIDTTVLWGGDYDPSCVKDVEVCWTYPDIKVVACTVAPADATSLQLKSYHPCQRFTLQVTAVSKDGSFRDPYPGYGISAPPAISELQVKQKSCNVAVLTWPSLAKYSCVTGLNFWICDNETQDLSTCISRKLSAHTHSFELDRLEACRFYYAVTQIVNDDDHHHLSSLSTIPLYIDSATEVTKVKATNVTHSSAEVRWSVSDPNSTCQTGQMTMCYREVEAGVTGETPDCWSWTLDQADAGDGMEITDLSSCTAYEVTVNLRTSVGDSNRTTTFTTPLHGEAIDAAARDVSDTSALVTWSFDAERLDCRPVKMQVCYSADGGGRDLCHSLASAARRVSVEGLQPCSRYKVFLTLQTAVSPQPTRTLHLVTTSKDHPVLETMFLTAVLTTVEVRWTITNASSLQCVRLYNVSWYSSGDARRTWQTLAADSTYFDIFGASRGQTYFVELSVVFLDGSAETLAQHVDVPYRSGSSRFLGNRIISYCTFLLWLSSTWR